MRDAAGRRRPARALSRLPAAAGAGAENPGHRGRKRGQSNLCRRPTLRVGCPPKGRSGKFGPVPFSDTCPPPSPVELAPLFPELEIIELVGRGGMGVVYKARQKHLDRFVALKILSPTIGREPAFAERFAREARALAMLSHPHIVAVYDFGQTRGEERLPTCRTGGEGGLVYYFLMEFVDGVNLPPAAGHRKLRPRKPWPSCRRFARPCNTPTIGAWSIATSSLKTSFWTSVAK